MPRKAASKQPVITPEPEPEPEPVQEPVSDQPKQSHLTFVDALPEDSIRIPRYLEHQFESLYYSPSNDAYYQSPKTKYRLISHGKNSFNCRSDDNKTIRISIKNLKKMLEEMS